VILLEQNGIKQHSDKLKELKKRFRKLKIRAIVIWLVYNVIVDTVAFVLFGNFRIEWLVFTIIVSTTISTLFMINTLNRWDKLRFSQESQLMEQTPMGRLKF
jgi:membrane protein YdbS with pleckstrin-like domain